jgi:hypothetical protein
MTQTTIINASPQTVLQGTQDLSTRPPVREAVNIPQHLPKIYLYAKKGVTLPQLLVGDTRSEAFHADSFDLRKPWANHATVLANLVNAEGNQCMYQRVIPADAGPESNLLLSLDVLPTTVPLYTRNADGSFVTDAQGAKVPTGSTVAGYTVKWVVTTRNTNVLMQTFGAAGIVAGDQTDTTTAAQSQRYPIMELKAFSKGAFGNDVGLRLWAPTNEVNTLVSEALLTREKAYPFFMALIRRDDVNSSPKVIETNFAEQRVTLTLKPGVIDPVTDSQLYVGDVFLDKYRNLTDPTYPIQYCDFGDMVVYKNNIKTLVDMFYAAEYPNKTDSSDFTGVANESYLFNMVSGQSSNGNYYNTFQILSTGTGVVRPSEYTNIYAKSGSDGTMSDALFADLVTAEVNEYSNSNSKLMDTAVNVESIIYDSGFPLDTKKALCNFIAVRKDTFVVLGTHTVGAVALTASEEHSLAVALRTRLQLTPESDYFGTPVVRGMIMGRSGKLRNSQFTQDVPTTMEIAVKAAKYMGAANGKWKAGSNFDGAPGSVLDNMTNFNVTFTPATARNKDWDVGLNWVQSYDLRSYFFPALKTVCSDDTSVLNSFFTAMAICEINKVAERVWRFYSGSSGANLSNDQLVEKVNAKTTSLLEGRFDNRFIMQPAAYVSSADDQRGYSWTLPVKIYASNMKTVMTTSVQAYRISDFVAA